MTKKEGALGTLFSSGDGGIRTPVQFSDPLRVIHRLVRLFDIGKLFSSSFCTDYMELSQRTYH